MRLNRKQKIFRNVLCCLALILLTYAALGFPPYTVRGMCQRERREMLLPELEPVYVLKEKHEYSDDWFKRQYTFIIARCEDTYVSFQYDRHGLQNAPDLVRRTDFTEGKGGLCVARRGIMYVAGDFKEIASASAVVRASNGTKYRDFELTGQRLTEEVFAFDYNNGEGDVFSFFLDEKTEEEMTLGEIAMYWYRTPVGDNGYSYDHADLPVTVTLYDESGAVLDTLNMEVGTYDLHSLY